MNQPKEPEPTPEAAPSHGALSGVFRHAVLWNLLGLVFSQGSGIVIFLIIASQVPPHVFGILALAALASDVVALDGRNAAMDAVVQAGRYDDKSLSSAFAGFFVIAVAIALALWLAAPYMESVYHEPLIATFMPLFGLTLIAVPWLAVMDAIMMRDLRYKQMTQRSIAATLVGGVVGIALAFSPWLIWAIFAQRLVGLIVAAALEYRYTRWLPKLAFDWKSSMDFVRRFFALWVVNTLISLINRVTTLLFGMRYDIPTVAYLRATNRISEAVQGPIISPLTGLWFPLMAKVRGNVAAERQVYNDIVRTGTFATLPAFAGLAVMSDDVVALLLPPEYAGVAPILRATAITLLLIPVLWFNAIALSALGMNKVSLAYTTVLVVSALTSLFLVSNVSAPDALLIMSIPCAVVGIGGNVILNRRLQQSNKVHYANLLPAVLAMAAMAASTYLAARTLVGWSIPLRLAVCVLLGAAVYGGWLWLFHRSWLADRIRLLRQRKVQ